MFDAERVRELGDAVPEPTALRPAVVAALDNPAGPGLLAALTALAPCELSSREQVEVCRAWTAVLAHCEAGRLQAVASLDRVVPRPRGGRYARSLRPAANELAARLGMSGHAASRLVGLARRADTDLVAAADALADGDIDASHLKVLAAVTKDAPRTEDVRALEGVAVASGRRRSPAGLRLDLEAEAARRVPEWFARRCRAGREERGVRLGPSPVPGCRRLTVDLPTVAATAVWLAVDGSARAARTHAAPDDHRTLPQLRADVLTALLTGGTAPPPGEPPLTEPVVVPGPERLAELAEVHVVLAADTLLGQSALPGHVPSAGPVDAEHGRDLARDARWRRVLTDPVTGAVQHVGERTYRPGARLRRHVLARDGTCVGATCTEPARTAQVDHTVPHADGGPTTAGNTGPLCDRDHEGKTHLGWRLEQPSPGRFEWTSPSGLTYAVPQRPALPGWQDRRPDWPTAAA